MKYCSSLISCLKLSQGREVITLEKKGFRLVRPMKKNLVPSKH